MKYLYISLCMLVGTYCGVYIFQSCKQQKIVRVEVEVPPSQVINVNQTFDLTGVEHTRKVLTNITVTSYNNHENQTDDTPNITATSRPVREGMVAVSRDFIVNNWVKYGDLIYIDCFNKWYVVEDTMNPRFEKRLDIFLFDKAESLKINKKCSIEIVHITK